MPRSPAKRGDSKLGGLTGSMRPKRTLGQHVELPSPSVSFKLAVPSLGVELHKPLPKPSQFLRREITNLLLKILDLTHTTTSFSGQCTQQPLDGVQVGAGFEQVGGKGVAERVDPAGLRDCPPGAWRPSRPSARSWGQ